MSIDVILFDYHAFILLKNKSMIQKTKITKFFDDFNSHEKLIFSRIHKRRVAKIRRSDNYFYYCFDKEFEYEFIKNENEYYKVFSSGFCARQKNMIDNDMKIIDFKSHNSNNEKKNAKIRRKNEVF